MSRRSTLSEGDPYNAHLQQWISLRLAPLFSGDAGSMAEYVVALLGTDADAFDPQSSCHEKLADFLEEGTTAFVSALFGAIADESYKHTPLPAPDKPDIEDVAEGRRDSLSEYDSQRQTQKRRRDSPPTAEEKRETTLISPIHSTTLPPPREGPHCAAGMSDVVRLRVGGVLFEAEKSTLLRFDHTFFCGLFSSGAWQPEADGAFFIDRPAMGFDRILEYLSSGMLSVEGLSDFEEDCVYSSLDYLLIPYRRQWRYNTAQVIEGFTATYVIELKDGRLCGLDGAYFGDITVWNMDTSAVVMTLEGHTAIIYRLVQLQDGRLCSCSRDRTIKLWSIDSGLCQLTLTGHTDGVNRMIQLFDGRLCSSGSSDLTIRVWNVFSGICEMTINARYGVHYISQLSDGRICCGGIGGTICIYSVLTGECELSWTAHDDFINVIVCIDATTICSSSYDSTIKVWSTATGECERTLEDIDGDDVTSMVLMHDGRLCNASSYGTLELWNLETGDCEKTLCSISNLYDYHNIMQLIDGRLVSCFDSTVHVWS